MAGVFFLLLFLSYLIGIGWKARFLLCFLGGGNGMGSTRLLLCMVVNPRKMRFGRVIRTMGHWVNNVDGA